MFIMRRKTCQFCKKNVGDIDYRDTDTLKRYLGIWAKIKRASETGTCAKHQRRLAQAIKRSRFLALLPYVTR